jgi:hypothetical protein
VTPDQLGSLLAGTTEPDLWFLDALVESAAKVLARSGGGDLVFVGRSLDSMFDLLGGALAQTDVVLSRFPISFDRGWVADARWRYRRAPLSVAERTAAHLLLADIGVTPYGLARRAKPVAFVDVVDEGSTFTEMYTLLRDWIDDERGPWVTIRQKIRFVGVTVRGKTSPNKYRWQQQVAWTRELPAGSVVNVSLDGAVWRYFGNQQVKLNQSFIPEEWVADAPAVDRDDETRQALAEAVALVSYGRTVQGRRALARGTDREPALAQSWLRSLVTQLNRGS